MACRFGMLFVSLFFLSSFAFPQGLATTATKDDWEEINFEFNMSVLTDGYPSLLRVAELLSTNPEYKVKLTGHADWIGSHPYNDKLALARANMVKTFLEKYGARPGQVTVETQGERSPKVNNNTKEGRWMNRRVQMTVTDGQGRVVSAGGVGDTIKALEALSKKQEECCSQILKRLDDLAALVRDLKGQNDKLQRDIDELKGRAPAPAAPSVLGTAPTPTPTPAAPAGPTPQQLEQLAERAAKKAADEVRGTRMPKFSILGLNAGPDGSGDITFSGKGRFFAPFDSHTAFQAQGEYLYFRDRKEGQIDFGLVSRWKSVQLGGFSSFKTVGFKEYQNNGTLGQFAGTFDYIFRYGKVGAFGTKSFLDKPVVNRAILSRNILEETYLRVVDQLGGQATVSLGRRAWLEGNLGYLHRQGGDSKPGGTLRFVFPLSRLFAFTVEGGINETLVGNDTNGRAVFGIQFGNFLNPRDYATVDHPVPVDVPRIRYELLTRRIRTGNDPPIADAGPDQIGAAAGTIQLDGSRSFDPDGDPITYQWAQIAGPTVTLANPTTARPSFTAVEGVAYSFGLTVRDDKGGQSIDRVTVTTREAPRVRIIRFTANPPFIRPGENSTLNYVVENADTVTISGVSETLSPTTGSARVTPAVTTNYTLTARNRVSEDTAVVTVLVDRPLPRIIRFTATPATINSGDKSTLQWETQDADSVEIAGVGSFAPNGSVEVMPPQTQAYTLIARNRFGEATAATVVTVQTTGPGPGQPPVIVSFMANPVEIDQGNSSTLIWEVRNADEVTITTLPGRQNLTGSAAVTPAQTTTYTLTATNRTGATTAQATVTVNAPVRIISFTATPSTINRPGQVVTFEWRTENALHVIIDGGIGQRAANGSLANAGPVRTQTYTLTAFGRSSTATASVTVTLDPTTTPTNRPPTVVLTPSNEIVTAFRELKLNAAASSDPDGDRLTFSWRSVDGRGTVLDPTSSTPTVKLNDTTYGDLTFEVTVTDPGGLSSKANVRVIYVLARPTFGVKPAVQ